MRYRFDDHTTTVVVRLHLQGLDVYLPISLLRCELAPDLLE
jgi:hypothetical protein